jgi:wyosine [tRNA(Phe)-imidazoG37] synthetase (radical SAM superfamily)
MPTFLFNEIIFGPIKSRRLGNSLGINLLPIKSKLCNFNCVYCECGLNDDKANDPYPQRESIAQELEKKLITLKDKNNLPDVITFAGNGEPTMHPQFSKVIDDTIALRNTYAPQCEITVLSNATMLRIPKVMDALKRVDRAFLKIDSAITATSKMINQPAITIPLDTLALQMLELGNKLNIQTMFLRGSINGILFDNTSVEEIEALISFYKTTNPAEVQIYSIARDTPINTLETIKKEELLSIAALISQHGIPVNVF